MRSTGQTVDGGLLAGMPTILCTHALLERITLRCYQRGYTIAELGTNLLHSDICVFHCVMKGCGCQ